MENPVRLTSFSHAAGCGCKIAPAVLDQIIKTDTSLQTFPQLLVGNSSKDDAAVYDLGNGTCVVSTTDFFMPIVDDAFDFGRIAGANAISDVYAMGGSPLMAIAVLGWPVDKLPAELAAKVLEGCRAVCAEANIPLAGGHSIDSPEPFFGLAVTGTVTKEQLRQNNTACEGDLIFLTKPVGVGILSTTMKRGELPEDHYNEMIRWMTKLNSIGAKLATIKGVHAMTDVTGFGLMGHLIEMCEGSGLGATLHYNEVAVAMGVREGLQKNMIPDATYRNWNAYSTKVKFAPGVNVMEAFKLLPDPQTNGGIMVAVSPEDAGSVESLLKQEGLELMAKPIGTFTAVQEKLIMVQ